LLDQKLVLLLLLLHRRVDWSVQLVNHLIYLLLSHLLLSFIYSRTSFWVMVHSTSRLLRESTHTSRTHWLLSTHHEILRSNYTQVIHKVSCFQCQSIPAPSEIEIYNPTLKLSNHHILILKLSRID
jgi:hypothetical protein